MSQSMTLGDILGAQLEEDFRTFDLTEVQTVLQRLQDDDAIDLSHVERLQQQALRGADVLSEYLAKIVKTVAYLESQVNSTKNRVSLEYMAPDGARTTAEMRKWAGDASPEVEKVQIKLAEAKGAKVALERKFDIIVKAHHHWKEIASGLRRTVLGYNVSTPVPEGYE